MPSQPDPPGLTALVADEIRRLTRSTRTVTGHDPNQGTLRAAAMCTLAAASGGLGDEGSGTRPAYRTLAEALGPDGRAAVRAVWDAIEAVSADHPQRRFGLPGQLAQAQPDQAPIRVGRAGRSDRT